MLAFLQYNQDIILSSDFHIDAQNRAFQYGDGVFETLIFRNGAIQFLTDHLQRLRSACKALYLDINPDFNDIFFKESIENLLKKNTQNNRLQILNDTLRIKISVWRVSGGLYTPTHTHTGVLISIAEASPSPIIKPKTLIYEAFRLTQTPISAYKTLNALPYVMAGLYKKVQNIDEVLLLDTNDHLSESISASLFWIENEIIYTPTLQTGCKAGIMRKKLLQWATQNAVETQEANKKISEINPEAFFTANVASISYLRIVEQQSYATHHKFVEAFRAFVAGLS